MTRPNLHDLWDAYRDGELSPGERRAFEAQLREQADAGRLFDAESRWLNELADDVANLQRRDGAAFAGDVVDQWSRKPADGVVARVGRHRLATACAWAASVAALVVLGVWLGDGGHRSLPTGGNGPGGVAAIPQTPGVVQPNPVAALLSDMDAQVTEQPARIRQAVERTASMLDVNRVFSLLDVPVPDPAQYVEPEKKS